ncbi:MAG TPA: hypothetical protein VIK60_10445 [Vicinamibacterales bacterium]
MAGYSWTDPAVLTFIAIPVALVAALLWCVDAAWRRLDEPLSGRRRALTVTALAAAAWMGVTWIAADSGVLRRWDATPPPLAFLIAGIVALAAAIAFSRYGGRLAAGLPIAALIALQGFRLPLELAMHEMYERGVMPVQMSYSGRNFDIITGVSAFVVAGLVAGGRAGRWVIVAWNVLGLLLLLNVVTIAILSTPLFRYFGDDRLNVWVTYPPFVWLPAVMVLAALAGHLLVFRAIGTGARRPSRAREPR